MKNINIAVGICTIGILSSIAGCNSGKQDNQQSKITAQNEVQTSVALNYTDSADRRISANEERYKNFEDMLEEQNKDSRIHMSSRLTEIKHKNDSLQERLDAYNNDTDKEQWVAFKADFTSRMDSVDKEFHELTVSYN